MKAQPTSGVLILLALAWPAALAAQSTTLEEQRYLRDAAANAQGIHDLAVEIARLPDPQPLLLEIIIRNVRQTYGTALVELETTAAELGYELSTSESAVLPDSPYSQTELRARLQRQLEQAAILHTRQAQSGASEGLRRLAAGLAEETRGFLDRWRELKGYHGD